MMLLLNICLFIDSGMHHNADAMSFDFGERGSMDAHGEGGF